MYTLTTIKSVNVSASLYLIWSNVLLMSKSKKFSIEVQWSCTHITLWKYILKRSHSNLVQWKPFLQRPNGEKIIATIYKNCQRLNKS